MLKAQLAFFPGDIPVLAVGGIKPDNMRPWLDAGATGFGLGGGPLQARASRPPRRSTRRGPMSRACGA